jgi:hypothetical protein
MAHPRLARPAPFKRASKSIAEFCRSHGVSRRTFENWRAAGVAPALTQPIPGGRILISEQAEQAWLLKYTEFAAAE